ncbi:hypothetical protein [Limimaricola litoreus]|uniref:Uncharacterized protein n=1 Tax=Limimaricola litoreus TaxID=2955316 RepID=A0A9X2FS95_9RHOB|nr:hypothetical protein [Limimaricola litoreus]MCP1169164.1 hypothetical protein [Limimaricola litoreus]
MAPLAETLWTLEKRHWFDGAEFYQRRLDAGGELVILYPADLQDRDAALRGLRPARQWEAIEMTGQTLQQEGDTVLLSYDIVAWRNCCSTPLRARCASTYLSDDGTWYRLSHERDERDGSETVQKVRMLRRKPRAESQLGAA